MAHLPPRPRTRLAPTPSGFLHAGNAVNFLIAWKLARAAGGTVLLRIDDLDSVRARPEHIEDIFRSLQWLGIDWDEGPSGPDELARSWTQRSRIDAYLALATQLRNDGRLFACTCSRSTMEHCDCRDRSLPFEPVGTRWRLRVDPPCPVSFATAPQGTRTTDLATVLPDPVLRQSDGSPAYQLASLADDARWRIDLIVRGNDLLPSTACQVHLSQLLGLPAFAQARFIHHPLVLDDEGGKLSKSAGATSLKAMREAGRDARDLHARAERMIAELAQA